nr:molybdenum cofactor guanylyltransferase [Rhodococcus opacus]
MGTSKAALEWHGSTLLRRTVALLTRTIEGPIVVVRAPGQELPALPDGVEVVEDPCEGRGPLQGIASGLAAVGGRASRAFICPTDMPFLHPAFVHAVLSQLRPGLDVALPIAHGYSQPLAAAYRPSVALRAAQLSELGLSCPTALLEEVRVVRLDEASLLCDTALAAADPDLNSLINVNKPAEYRDALSRPCPEVKVYLPGGGLDKSTRAVRAATLRAAATAAEVVITPKVVIALNGVEQTTLDLDLPLVAGDTLAFCKKWGGQRLECSRTYEGLGW